MNNDIGMTNHPKVVFVGSFNRPADGTLGGQLFACTSLVNSPLKDCVVWQLVDSSQRSLPPPPIWIRGSDALRRVFKAARLLMRRDVKAGLVFTSYRPLSLLEKMFMCAWGGLCGKGMVVTFRSEIRPFGKTDWLMRPFLKMSLALTRHVICQSREAAESFARIFPKHKGKTVVIANWIDTKEYQAIAEQRKIHAASKSRRNASTVFLFLGWLEPNKGVHDLLAAAKILANAGLDFRLRIGGSGSQHGLLEKMALDLNLAQQVEFLGWIAGAAKKSVMGDADVLVLPSYSEGMPNSVLEGMAAALPVIATNVGGIPSLVIAGKTGLLVKPGQPQELAVAMQRLIENPEERIKMGLEGAAKVEQEHSVEQAWKKIGAILLPLCGSAIPAVQDQ